MKKYLFFFLICTTALHGMHKISLLHKKALFAFSQKKYMSSKHQYKAIPHFLDLKKMNILQTWMDDSEKKGELYDELYDRKGCSWDDCLLTTDKLQFIKKYSECPPSATYEDGTIFHVPKVRSIFDYPEPARVVFDDIFPKIFHEIKGWYAIPKIIRTQIIFISCIGKDKGIDWHRDPSSYEEPSKAGMVIMLNDNNHPQFGWNGGHFLIKEGMPQENNPTIETLIPSFNQALLYKNDRYSHSVTPILPKYGDRIKRNFLFIALY